jgi:elongation factor 1-beta
MFYSINRIDNNISLLFFYIPKMSKYDITNQDSLKQLEEHLTTNNFIGGSAPNGQDSLVYEQFGDNAPCVSTYPSISGWFLLLRYFSKDVKDSWIAEDEKKAATKKPAPKKEEKKEVKKEDKTTADDVDDMFGDDAEEESEEDKKAREERLRAEKEKKKGGAKPAVIAKSLILLDIKVFELEQDLDSLAKKILTIELDGLFWKTEYKLLEVAFGMRKIRIGMVVEDAKVSVDDIIERISSWEEEVQSVDIVSFDKI